LTANRESHPLFDVERLARHLECAYDQMWERFERGLGPAEIEVPPLPADATAIGRGRP
jgi:LPS sulfotransferase NodH